MRVRMMNTAKWRLYIMPTSVESCGMRLALPNVIVYVCERGVGEGVGENNGIS